MSCRPQAPLRVQVFKLHCIHASSQQLRSDVLHVANSTNPRQWLLFVMRKEEEEIWVHQGALGGATQRGRVKSFVWGIL